MLDKKIALILLTEMEMLRQTQTVEKTNEDFLIKSCQAIVAFAAGYISRLDWSTPINEVLKQNVEFQERLAIFKEWQAKNFKK
jgi:hypothetical protein